MSIELRSEAPKYGENYRKGHVGFTYTKGSIISCGIAWFTRWDRMSDIKVSHVFMVTGENECIEALPEGVVVSNVQKYFDNPKVQVFFREPRLFNQHLIDRTVGAMRSQVGQKYGYSLIVANAIGGSFLGRITGLGRLLCKWLDGKKSGICSEAVAAAMKAQAEYDGIGVLRLAASQITPQPFFEDDATFKPWKKAPTPAPAQT